jgi:hypothetical protein
MNEKLIEKYGMKLNEDKTQIICDGNIKKSSDDVAYVKEHKDELISVLKRMESEAEQKRIERQKKIAAIEGLDQIQTTISQWVRYNNGMSRYIERDMTGKAPKKPEVTIEELNKLYPRAAAYIKADRWSYSAHYFKAACGKAAKEAILNDVDYKEAIEDMECAWKEYTEEQID